MNNSETIYNEWYQQPWVWFVIGLLFLTMLASFAMLWVAAANPPDLVVEDYGNIEELTALTRTQDQRAAELDLRATVRIAPAREGKAGYYLEVTMRANDGNIWPGHLDVRTFNSTLAELDTAARLDGGDGVYRGHLLLPANSYVLHLNDPEHSWRLTGRVTGRPAEVELTAYQPGALNRHD